MKGKDTSKKIGLSKTAKGPIPEIFKKLLDRKNAKPLIYDKTTIGNKPMLDCLKAIEELDKKYKIKKTITANDIDDFPNGFRIGDEISRNPVWPTNSRAAFELFKNFYAEKRFEIEKCLFLSKYKGVDEIVLKTELEAINDWTGEAEKINGSNAVDGKGEQCEYWRLTHDHYYREVMDNRFNEMSMPAFVYARYVLLKEWLEKGLQIDPESSRKKNNQVLTFTSEERKIVELLSKGKKFTDIASEIHLSYETVKNRFEKMRKKFNCGRDTKKLIEYL
jgi:DNA-binding CsgD family transcriptional regulator